MVAKGANTGTYFMNGDEACSEGALAAGCRFFAGYPITPATEIAEEAVRIAAEICIYTNDRITSEELDALPFPDDPDQEAR